MQVCEMELIKHIPGNLIQAGISLMSRICLISISKVIIKHKEIEFLMGI